MADNSPERAEAATDIQIVTPVQHPDLPALNGGPERYELLEEIARGGMGIVYRARDRVLEREVGLKTLLQVPEESSAAIARFLTEARITGQLQHPNIPPVHDLGTLNDGRPFLAMKLIEGRTLEAELQARTDPAHDRGRFLAIFEHIAQGVAYAHIHRVIHRDLKPQNVMVSNFGEVQVMDWGLAKNLPSSPDRTTAEANTEVPSSTVIHSAHSQSNETHAGGILGTPAYMPREQAIGAIDQIDTRSDVFSLGGILCFILTGKPPYVGGDVQSTRQLAASAKLNDAFARLDACGAEPGLIALCKWCLSLDRDNRPQDANEVAKAVAGLRAEAEQRARQAELDRVRVEGQRAKAELQVAELRKRRRVQLTLLATAMLLFGSIGAFAWWEDKRITDYKLKDAERSAKDAERRAEEARLAGERDAETRNKARQARDGVNAGLALAADLRKQAKFRAAEAALTQAAELAKIGTLELLPEVKQAQRDLAFVAKLNDIRFRKWIYVADPGGTGDFNTRIASPEYRQAFAERGLDLTTLDSATAAQQIASSAVKSDIILALDDWALYEPNESLRNRLLAIARTVDPGPWTDRLRDSSLWKNKSALAKLAADADPEHTPSAVLGVLATLMERNDLDPSPLLSTARLKYPTDFELAFALGQWFTARGKAGEPIGPYEAARTSRPDNIAVWINLGIALARRGDADGAIAVFKEAIKLDPHRAATHTDLGIALVERGDKDAAIGAFKQAIKLNPQDARSHYNLGLVLKAKNDVNGALAAFKEATQHEPKNIPSFHNLGILLYDRGDRDGAIGAFKNSIQYNPKFVNAYNNLGIIYFEQMKYADAIACARQALAIDPNYSYAYALLGRSLLQIGDIAGARAALTEAARLDKKWKPLLTQLPPLPASPPSRNTQLP